MAGLPQPRLAHRPRLRPPLHRLLPRPHPQPLAAALFFTDVFCDDYEYIRNPRVSYMMGTFTLGRDFRRVDVHPSLTPEEEQERESEAEVRQGGRTWWLTASSPR